MDFKNRFKGIIDKYGSRTYLIDSQSGAELTYSAFSETCSRTAAELGRLGIKKGDRVAVLAPNCIEFAILYFSCVYSGAVAVPVNQNLGEKDIAFIITNSGAKLVIHSAKLSEKLASTECRNRIVLALKHEPAEINGKALDPFNLPAAPGFIPFNDSRADDLVAVMYTSGTTSKPKGVVHRLSSMIHNAEVFSRVHGLSQDFRFMHTFSMAYMAGFFNLLILPFINGASVVLGPTFSAMMGLKYWETPIKYNVNALWLVPSIMALLLKVDRGDTGSSFCRNKVKIAFAGTAPLPAKIKEEFEAKYGIAVYENYGLSETLFISTEYKGAKKSGALGKVLPEMTVMIDAESGNMKESEIMIKTPDIMSGYLDARTGEITRITPDEWFHTGDYGLMDKDGFLSITGRKKDIIIRGGINISPKAIEEELIRHESVDEVYVIGIPHELYGEDIVAAVKLKPGFDFEAAKNGLAAFAVKNLAQHQQPALYVRIDEFPTGIGGKIQKHKLKDLIINKLHLPK